MIYINRINRIEERREEREEDEEMMEECIIEECITEEYTKALERVQELREKIGIIWKDAYFIVGEEPFTKEKKTVFVLHCPHIPKSVKFSTLGRLNKYVNRRYESHARV